MLIFRAAVLLAALAPACATAPRRAVLVLDAGVETERAAAACPEVVRTLGEPRARALLEGHIVRPGQGVVLAVREWFADDAEPSRRTTLALDGPTGERGLDVRGAPSASFARARFDGSAVRPLAVAAGRVRVELQRDASWRVDLDVRFTDPAEPPLRLSGSVPVRSLDQIGPIDGRAVPRAQPEEYLHP